MVTDFKDAGDGHVFQVTSFEPSLCPSTCFVHAVADLSSDLLVSYQMHRTLFSHSAYGGSKRHVDSLRVGRFGVRIPVRARFSPLVQTGLEAYTASFTIGTGALSRG